MCAHKLAVFYFLLHFMKQGESKAVSSSTNQTMYHYYVFPMSDWEAESIQRQSRQQDGPNSNAGANDNNLPPAGTASNVVNILTGFLSEDVRPILSGSTAFIPPGGLRQGVTGLLQGLAPALQRVFFGDSSNLPPRDYTIATAAPVPRTEPPTSPRPRRIRTTTNPLDSTSPGVTPEENSEEETESPSETSSASSLSSSSLQPTTSSAESDEETEAPPSSLATNAPAVTPASPQSPQVNDPSTEKVNAAIPESPQAQSEPATESILPNQPESPPPPKSQANSNMAPNVTQLKVVLEDPNSIVTANVISNANGEEKQYIYLVLLPEQYEQLNKLTATVQQQSDTEVETVAAITQPDSEQAVMESETQPPTKQPEQQNQKGIMEFTTTKRSNRYRYKNKNGTSTIPPPHLQLQYYYRLTSTPASTTTSTTTTTTTTTVRTTSTDLPGVSGFENEDDELEN